MRTIVKLLRVAGCMLIAWLVHVDIGWAASARS